MARPTTCWQNRPSLLDPWDVRHERQNLFWLTTIATAACLTTKKLPASRSRLTCQKPRSVARSLGMIIAHDDVPPRPPMPPDRSHFLLRPSRGAPPFSPLLAHLSIQIGRGKLQPRRLSICTLRTADFAPHLPIPKATLVGRPHMLTVVAGQNANLSRRACRWNLGRMYLVFESFEDDTA